MRSDGEHGEKKNFDIIITENVCIYFIPNFANNNLRLIHLCISRKSAASNYIGDMIYGVLKMQIAVPEVYFKGEKVTGVVDWINENGGGNTKIPKSRLA